MKVIFKKRNVNWPLTVGKEYDAVRLHDTYRVLCDDGKTDTYHIDHFKVSQVMTEVGYTTLANALELLAGYGFTHHTTEVAGAMHLDKDEVLASEFPSETRKQELEKIIAEATAELNSL